MHCRFVVGAPNIGFNQLYDFCCVCYGSNFYGLKILKSFINWLLQVWSELSRIICVENVSGAKDCLEKALKLVHREGNLTKVEVVEAIQIIQH